MKIRKSTRGPQTVYVGNIKHMLSIAEWTQALFHAIYGKEEGETRYSKVRFVDAMDLWVTSL